jgi:hypothetical protein
MTRLQSPRTPAPQARNRKQYQVARASPDITVSASRVGSALVQCFPSIGPCQSYIAFRPIGRATRLTVPDLLPNQTAKPAHPGARLSFSLMPAFSMMACPSVECALAACWTTIRSLSRSLWTALNAELASEKM